MYKKTIWIHKGKIGIRRLLRTSRIRSKYEQSANLIPPLLTWQVSGVSSLVHFSLQPGNFSASLEHKKRLFCSKLTALGTGTL